MPELEIFIIPFILNNKLKRRFYYMAKLSAWLVTLIGVLWLLPLLNVDIGADLSNWLIGLSFLVMGIGKLMRNYGSKRK